MAGLRWNGRGHWTIGNWWRAIAVLLLVGSLFACSPVPNTTRAEQVPPSIASPPAETPASSSLSPDLEQRLQAFLAAQTGLPATEIKLAQHEDRDWSDACIGAAQVGELCAQVITPGYRVVLATPRGTYVVHSDRIGNTIRLVESPQ